MGTSQKYESDFLRLGKRLEKIHICVDCPNGSWMGIKSRGTIGKVNMNLFRLSHCKKPCKFIFVLTFPMFFSCQFSGGRYQICILEPLGKVNKHLNMFLVCPTARSPIHIFVPSVFELLLSILE